MKKIALVFTLYMCATVIVFAQSDIDFEIREKEGTITINKYKGTVKDVRIPERINGLPVTAIGFKSFSENQLTGVTIPNSVTTIAWLAFLNNRLTSVTIPASVTYIGDRAFRDNQLTSVTLPDNVNIHVRSFDYYSIYTQYIKNGKKQHTFTISPPATIGAYEIVSVDNTVVEILKYNGNEKDVRIPERINGLPVIAIGDQAFMNNQLTSVTIPNSVTAIGANTFQGNRLTGVIISNSITFIGNNAFRGNQLTSVTIPNAVTIEVGAFFDNQLTSVTVGANVTLESNAIGGLESAYNNGGKRAVTYTFNTDTNSWTAQYR